MREILPVPLRRLLWMRASAKFSRISRRLLAPRRILFTVFALALSALWIGNTAMAILLRPPADPTRLEGWITGGLVLYAFWHLLRSVWDRDLQGVMWTESEREMLWTAPFSVPQLVTFRLVGLVGPVAFKALLLAAFMLPEATRPELAFIGLCMALLILELVRMVIEILCWGLDSKRRGQLRLAVSVIAVATAIAVAAYAWANWLVLGSAVPLLAAPRLLLQGLESLGTTQLALMLGMPLRFLADLSVSLAWSPSVVLWVLIGFGEIILLTCLVFWLYGKMSAARIANERAQYDLVLRENTLDEVRSKRTHLRLDRRVGLPRWAAWQTMGALPARQLVTIARYWLVTIITLLAPALLSLFPVLLCSDAQAAVLNVLASLVFYTLLLGPPALKIDFRRDLDRMLLLCQLPLSPIRLVLGQILVPVLVCVAFQVAVLLATISIRPVDLSELSFAVSVLVPCTLFVFALENAIFLAFPQRVRQEGLEVLVRTSLVFTLKGLLFGLGMASVLVWAMLVAQLPLEYQSVVFSLGGIAAMWVLALGTVHIASCIFSRFDLSADVPAE